MPLKKGYSYATVRSNIAELLASRVEKPNAYAAAYGAARVAFFKRFPQGALPAFLTGAGNKRLAQYFDKRGQLLQSNPKSRAQTEVNRAAKLIKDFSGHDARVFGKMSFPENPKIAIAIGQVLGISYETKRDGVMEKYYHRFTLKHSRPLLVSSPDGTQLFILGGEYDFTERGIVDRK